MPPRAGFTFYGDLLGIGAAYRLSTEAAFDKLNRFYNIIFNRFQALCIDNTLRVNLFSDSLLIWGDDPLAVIEPLQRVYLELINEALLMRGALVDGKLERDPRLEVRNLDKFLPSNDTLARAVGLEESTKGARFLISPELGEGLLSDVPAWRTIEGYVQNARNDIPLTSILRRICPLPEGKSYELLYFWSSNAAPGDLHYKEAKNRLKEISQYLLPAQAIHYRETIEMLKRSELRERSTRRAFHLEHRATS